LLDEVLDEVLHARPGSDVATGTVGSANDTSTKTTPRQNSEFGICGMNV